MPDPKSYPYTTNLDIKYPPLTVVDVPALVADCKVSWYNQTLCKVNDSVARLGILQGEYHWHKHDNDDEFFFVLEGHLLIDLKDKTVDLGQWQGFTVPKGITHRTRAPEKSDRVDGGDRHGDPNWGRVAAYIEHFLDTGTIN